MKMAETATPPAPAPPDAERTEVLGLGAAEFEMTTVRFLEESREPRYRLTQLRDWIFRRAPLSFEAMSDLPKRLRERMESQFILYPITRREESVSRDSTRKLLWDRKGGGTIESVVIPDQDRVTYCISTQAGCPVKCTFCATGYGGFQGQLRPSEIVGQVLALRALTGTSPTNIVYMGMGEPLLNFEAVKQSLEVLTSPEQVGFGARRVTVSTVGIPDRIRELAELHPQVKLALSLHAARDDLRTEIIPLNRKHPLAQVLRALKDHVRITGKKVTLEYIVLAGLNDTERDARELVECLKGLPSRINLIGFNPFPEAPYSKPSVKRLLTFRSWIQRGYPGEVTIRRSRGEDIQGACGQLSLKHAQEASPAGPSHEKTPSRER